MRDNSATISLFGSLSLRPPFSDGSSAEDPYSLFVSYAASLGWDAVHTRRSQAAYWGMHDAAPEFAHTGRVTWFQVGLHKPRFPHSPSPILPLLHTAVTTTQRAGELDLDGVQLLLPLSYISDLTSRLSNSSNWFSDIRSSTRVRAMLTIDSGSSPDIFERRAAISSVFNLFVQDTVAAVMHLASQDKWVAHESSAAAPLWSGEEHSRVTFELSLIEWSIESLGYVVSAAAEACREARVTCPVLFDIARL